MNGTVQAGHERRETSGCPRRKPSTAQRTHDLERFLAAFDPSHTVAIEAQLKKLHAPTLIAWGTDDIYFDVKWANWLAAGIPGTRRNVRFERARIFFPEERWQNSTGTA